MQEWHREDKESKGKVLKIESAHAEIIKKMLDMDVMHAENDMAHTEMMESICKINIKSVEDDIDDMKSRITNDMKELHEQVREARYGGTGQDEKSERIEWENKLKRADFNKPSKWSESEKNVTFEQYGAAVRRWGHKLHENFTDMLINIENGSESKDWEASEFEGMKDEELKKIDRALYDILEETIDDGLMAKGYVNNTVRSGIRAWRKLAGRFDSKRGADRQVAYQRILEPGKYLGQGKNAEEALDKLTKWENEMNKYQSRFGKELDEDTIRIKVGEIMPPRLFGEEGPFRGRNWMDWKEMRTELVKYLEDKPYSGRGTGGVQNLNPVIEKEE